MTIVLSLSLDNLLSKEPENLVSRFPDLLLEWLVLPFIVPISSCLTLRGVCEWWSDDLISLSANKLLSSSALNPRSFLLPLKLLLLPTEPELSKLASASDESSSISGKENALRTCSLAKARALKSRSVLFAYKYAHKLRAKENTKPTV